MKARHFIMIIILVIAISFVISNKGVEKLVCTTEGELYESPSKSTLEISIKDNKIKDMYISIDVKLNDELMQQRDLLVQNIEAQGKSQVTKIDDGIRLSSGMSGSYFESMGITEDTKVNELKEVLEVQGFKCK